MIIKTYEAEKVKNTKLNFFLLYGENNGFKNEIINKILTIGFEKNIIKYDETDIINKPDLISSEILNKSFFNDKKIIIISRATDKVNKILEDFLDKELEDIRIIINAGLLDKRSKLRGLFEKKKNLICIPFYADNNLTLINLASLFFKKRGILVSQETTNLLVERCRGNRENLNNELTKIESFALGKKNITTHDIAKLTNLAENYSYTELCDQCLIKNSKKISQIFNENNYGSEDCIAITRTMINKTKRLIKLKESCLVDTDINNVVSKFKPPIFWKDKEMVKNQIKKWSINSISNLLYELNDLELLLKKNNENSLNILNDFILTKSKANS